MATNTPKTVYFNGMKKTLGPVCSLLLLSGLFLTGCAGSGTGRVFPPSSVRLTWRPGITEKRPQNVFISGTFNEWHMNNPAFKCAWNPLENGFSITLTLPPGRYEYKFVVDGHWIHDRDARESAPDPLGGRLGVFYVKEPAAQ